MSSQGLLTGPALTTPLPNGQIFYSSRSSQERNEIVLIDHCLPECRIPNKVVETSGRHLGSEDNP